MSTLEVNTLDSVSGTSTLTIGGSNAGTIALGSGDVQSNFLNPIFYGELASDQTLTRSTTTKVAGMTNNEIDTNTAFDGTTFTVPSGQAGKYFIAGQFVADYDTAGADGEQHTLYIYKNGSQVKYSEWQFNTNTLNRIAGLNITAILSLSASDTVEMYARLQDASANTGMVLKATHTTFSGYRIGT